MIRFLPGLMIMGLLVGCAEDSIAPKGCILESMEFDARNRYRFVTVGGGTIYEQRQEVEDGEGNVEVLASFRFTYFADSVVVTDQLNPAKYPYLRAKLENDQPVEVVRYFPGPDVLLTHFITYESDRFQVDMYRLASTGAYDYVAYGIYHTNAKGHVTRLESFFRDLDNPGEFVKSDDRFFLYDDSLSPLMGLYLPFFAGVNLPDVAYFSPNNIVTDQSTDLRYDYQYAFDENGNTTIQFASDGASVKFRYLNCD